LIFEDIFNHQFHPAKFCLWQPSFGGFNPGEMSLALHYREFHRAQQGKQSSIIHPKGFEALLSINVIPGDKFRLLT